MPSCPRGEKESSAADNKHAKVDDRPFGGGPGMVMMCQPLHDCVQAIEKMDETPATRILLTPQGEVLKQKRIEELAKESRLMIIAGHYEGVDERVIDELVHPFVMPRNGHDVSAPA